jgi:isopentenyldiphosphate isomerase
MTDDEELVDYYNQEGEIIGFCSRIEADTKNYIYPNAIIFIFTRDKKVWIQKRSLHKRHYAGLWDVSACGAIAHGEDPKTAAKRELEEEMQIKCELEFVEKFLNVFPGEADQVTRSRMSHLYIGITDQTPEGNDEVEAIAAFEADELKEEIRLRPEDFVPSFDIEFLKALKVYEILQKN